MDYYPGGELFLHLSSKTISEEEAKIYFCEILAAMEFLHKHKILYRDLKVLL
jgi:serine/threonine protein kinase